MNRLHNGSILWGGVGSGKSITGLAYFYIRECKNMTEPKDLYIITTARKRDTKEWLGELYKFGIGEDKESNPGKIFVNVDSWNNIKKYVSVKNSFFIFDEQRVIGYGAWTKAFLKIVQSNRWILLSATPGDCWMDYLPAFIANGFYKTKKEFQVKHVLYNRYNTRYPQIKGYIGEKILRQHRDDILVGMSYEKHTVPHSITLKTKYSMDVYKAVMRSWMNPYTNEPISGASELCFVLRRVVNSDPDRAYSLIDIVKKHGKAIVFYNYDYELAILRNIAKYINWPVAEWNGHNHEAIPSGGHWMYLVQYVAGAEGWNCVETDTVIFYSKNYSYKTMIQAAGRTDRLNTAYHDLYYYYYTSDSPIDMALNRALKNKKNFNESAFAGQFDIRVKNMP